MTEPSIARLYVHTFNFPGPWRALDNWPASMLSLLDAAGFGSDQYSVEPPSGRRSAELDREVAAAAVLKGKKGAYSLRPASSEGAAIELYDYGTLISASIDIPFVDIRTASLKSVVDLAKSLNSAMAAHGDIGPMMWVILPGKKYPRPRSPRRSPDVGEAVWAYFFSKRHFATSADTTGNSLEKLESAPLPPAVTREIDGDAMVIRVKCGDEHNAALRGGLGQLEKWMGETLDLPRDEEFNEYGDQRWAVWRAEKIKPFSFYDPNTKIAYKVVAEDAHDRLDSETMAELKEILSLRSMPDGQPVESTMVVFVGRDAAVANAEGLRRLGASGTLYRDGEDFWNPQPPGEWLEG